MIKNFIFSYFPKIENTGEGGGLVLQVGRYVWGKAALTLPK